MRTLAIVVLAIWLVGWVDPAEAGYEVSAGQDHTYALDDAGVQCWGRNNYYQISVPALLSNPVQVSVGGNHTCAVDDYGVQCWGRNSSGETNVSSLLIDPDGDGVSSQGGQDAFPLDATEPDFDNPSDFDSDNRYNFSVRTSDGTQATETSFSIVVSESESNNELRNTLSDCVEQSGEDVFGRQLSNTFKCRLDSDNSSREFFVYIPEKYTNGRSPAALLLSLHGYTSTARANLGYSGFQSLADQEGFLVVYPQGTILPTTQETHWNVGGWTVGSETDDVLFIGQLLDHLEQNLSLDLSRIYSTGMSNGGFMSYELACQLSERIAAIASVTGSMTPETYAKCNPKRAVPVLQIHGRLDLVVPYAGNAFTTPIDEVMLYWSRENNCSPESEKLSIPDSTGDGLGGKTERFKSCDNNSSVELITLTAMRHEWPIANSIYRSHDLDAAENIWEFLSSFSLSLDTGSDGTGNNADTDDDNDGVTDLDDNCPLIVNPSQVDTDGDQVGDECDTDDDGDGVNDASDAFPLDATEFVDTDSDGIGNSADTDDDNDGVLDVNDAFPLDASEQVDTDGDGIGDNSDARPNDGTVLARQYLQTTSASQNITSLHILNTSDREQTFKGTLRDGDGMRQGSWSVPLGSAVPPMGRLTLGSDDLEDIFGAEPWSGPAMLRVQGESSFELMSKLISPSGLVSNTNCVREDRVLNIEGFDSTNKIFVRLINTLNKDSGEITGTLYDANGNVVGNAGSVLVSNLAPFQQVWVNRNDLADKVGAEWNGEALLEVNQVSGLKLLNLNYITDEQTFFNFSCFEDSTSGTVYLQTTSTSQNVSFTHLVNTSDVAQQLTGTLYSSDGSQVGAANQPLHSGAIAAKGRAVISSEDIETAFNISPWSGPAMLEVQGTDTFELMTKLTSPSGLISNTNCVRKGQVHNIGGFDVTDVTFIRFINIGDTTLSNIRGSLYDASGNIVGAENPVLVESLAAKSQIWRSRNQLSDLVMDTWNGTVSLKIDSAPDDLRLLNLNFINSETFFNFSCYEAGK